MHDSARVLSYSSTGCWYFLYARMVNFDMPRSLETVAANDVSAVDQYVVIWCNLCLFGTLHDSAQQWLGQSGESIQTNTDPLIRILERMHAGFWGRLHASYTTGGSLCEGWCVSKTAIHKCCQVQRIAMHIICYSQVTSVDTETHLKWNENWPCTGDEFACKPRGNGSDSAGQVLVAALPCRRRQTLSFPAGWRQIWGCLQKYGGG